MRRWFPVPVGVALTCRIIAGKARKTEIHSGCTELVSWIASEEQKQANYPTSAKGRQKWGTNRPRSDFECSLLAGAIGAEDTQFDGAGS